MKTTRNRNTMAGGLLILIFLALVPMAWAQDAAANEQAAFAFVATNTAAAAAGLAWMFAEWAYRGAEYSIEFVPKIKVEAVVADTVADKAVKATMDKAKTGSIGDGKIFVTSLSDAVRIRTGETGDAAL